MKALNSRIQAIAVIAVIAGILAVRHSPAQPRTDPVRAHSALPSQPQGAPPIATASLPAPPEQPTAPVPALADLPPSRDQLWARPAPEPEFASFQRWANAYRILPATAKDVALAEGIALAQTRRSFLAPMIEIDPQLALERAVSEEIRRAMPSEVAALLERSVDGRGDLLVDGAFPATESPITRTAVIGAQPFKAFT